MKRCFILIPILFVFATANAQNNKLAIADIDGDGIADTMRINREELWLVCTLSSQDFRPMYSYQMKELGTHCRLEPAANGFMLSYDNESNTLYREEYIFTFNPEYNRMELSTVNLKYSKYKMLLPGIAAAPVYQNCDFNFDLEKGKVSVGYSEGDGRVRKEFSGNRSVVPLQHFDFCELPGRLYNLKYGLAWIIMDELYPKEQRTAEFIDALPIDPRSPHLLVHDMDGDRLSDTVRIHPNNDDWTIIIECRLSTQRFNPVSTQSIGFDPRYSGLKPTQGGFVLRTNNTESDTYETSDTFVYDPASGKMLFSSSHAKHYHFYIDLPERIYELIFHEPSEIHYFPLLGQYIFEFTEYGEARIKEHTGTPVITSLEEFMSDNDIRSTDPPWNGFIQTIMDDLDFPARRDIPFFITEATLMNDTVPYLELYIDPDRKPEKFFIDRENGFMTLQVSSKGYTFNNTIPAQYINRIVAGHYKDILVLKVENTYYCFQYFSNPGDVLLSCVYRQPDYGERQYNYEEDLYFPVEGFVQKKLWTYRGVRDRINFDHDKYITLWETRWVDPAWMPFEHFNIDHVNSIIEYIGKYMYNPHGNYIEIPDKLIR